MRPRGFRTLPWASPLATLLAVLALAAPSSAGRIVAIADIHGAYDELVTLLRAAELVDGNGRWIGGDATLVQTGDFLDRGDAVRPTMDLLMSLQQQAAAAGGEVVVLLGNHEAMNLLGFRDDVSPGALASFADEDSEARIEEASKLYGRWLRQRARARRDPAPAYGAAEREVFRSEHPPGYLNYVEALSRDGRYGRWLRTLPMVVERGGVIFLHGGISARYASWSIDELNARMRQEIDLFDACRRDLLEDEVIFPTSDPNEMVIEGMAEISILSRRLQTGPVALRERVAAELRTVRGCVGYDDWFLVKGDSPIWFRGFARMEREELEPVVERALAGLGGRRFVVGHTPQSSRQVGSRLEGRIYLLDTGMLTRVYGGRASALEFVGDTVTAIYVDGRTVLEGEVAPSPATSPAPEAFESGAGSAPPGALAGLSGLSSAAVLASLAALETAFRDRDGSSLGFGSRDDVVTFLREADLEVTGKADAGINRPVRVRATLGGRAADAVFRSVDRFKQRHQVPGGRMLPVLHDSYRYEPAAFEVSRMLGMDRVPPAVLREIEGRRGSLQLWLHGVISEERRREQGHEPVDAGHWLDQETERRIFDRLIGNVDRNQGNLLIDMEREKVWLIDHTRSFIRVPEIDELQRVTRCPRAMWRGLRDTSEEELRGRMAPFLRESEVAALWERWKQLRDHVDDLLGRYGESVVLYEPSQPPSGAAAALVRPAGPGPRPASGV